MICSSAKDSYRDSIFKVNPKIQKEYTYGSALVHMENTPSMGFHTQTLRDSHLETVWKEARERESEDVTSTPLELTVLQIWRGRPSLIEVHLSVEFAGHLEKFFRVLTTVSGEPEYFVRRINNGFCFELCVSPIAGLTSEGRHNKQMYTLLRNDIHKFFISHNLWNFEIIAGGGTEILTTSEYAHRMIYKYLETSPETIIDQAHFSRLLNMTTLSVFPNMPTDETKLYSSAGAYESMFMSVLGLDKTLGEYGSSHSILTKFITAEKQCELNRMLPIITNDRNTPTFTFIDLSLFTEGPTPNFDSFISRIEKPCREYFMALFYAPLVANNSHRKITWIKSSGFDGKSTLFNAICTYFGGKFVGTFSASSIKGDFGYEPLIGKRILILSDCRNNKIIYDLHGITGNDTMSVNRKNQKEISYRFNSMLFIGSNIAPDMTSERNVQSRIAYIPMDPPTETQMKLYCYCDPITGETLFHDDAKTIPILKGSRMESGLVQEMPHILHKCKLAYEKLCEGDLEIRPPDGAMAIMWRDCGSDVEDSYATFFKKKYEFGKEFSIPFKDILDDYNKVIKDISGKNMNNNYTPQLVRYLEEQRLCKVVNPPSKKKGDVKMVFGIRKKLPDSTT